MRVPDCQLAETSMQFHLSNGEQNVLNRQLFLCALLLTGLAKYSRPANPIRRNSAPATATSDRDLSRLFNRIWRVTDAPEKPAFGSIYIFLANGTLLETSCLEAYRIATWTIDKRTPAVFRVVEDKQLAFTAVITELTDNTLRLRQSLARNNEKRDFTFKAAESEFVCPDLPK